MQKPNAFYKKNKRTLFTFLLVAMVLSFALLQGWKAIYTTDYVYMNGAIQNYNGPRRFLNGQIPYVDFANYLGLGHLYNMSAVLLFGGNHFTTSIFAAQFLTTMYAMLAIMAPAWLILQNRNQALLTGLAATLLLYHNYELVSMLFPEKNPMGIAIVPGNSARMLRYGGIFLFVFALPCCGALVRIWERRFALIARYRVVIWEILAACLSGLFVLWSNDTGPAIYLAFSLVYFVFIVIRCQKKIKDITFSVLRYIGCSALTLLLGIAVATRGHVGSWFAAALGNASYQYWYYDLVPKITSLLQLDLGYVSTIVLGAGLGFLLLTIKSRENKAARFRFGLLTFLCAACFLAAGIYHLGTGNISNDQESLLLYGLVCGGIAYFISRFSAAAQQGKLQKVSGVVVSVVCIASLFSVLWGQVALRSVNDTRDASHNWDDVLGGYVQREEFNSLNEVQNRLGDAGVFSTYAGVLEYRQEAYQPSGYDYIIHVLGDEARAQYLASFHAGGFDYVSTVRSHYPYEQWVRNANWFFYRELYAAYEPVFLSQDQIFWKKADQPRNDSHELEVLVSQITSDIVIIEVYAQGLTGVVDLALAYNTEQLSAWTNVFQIHSNIVVYSDTAASATSQPAFTTYNLPANENTHVPVVMTNGYGKIQLNANPRNMALTVDRADPIQFLEIPLAYVLCRTVEPTQIILENTIENRVSIENAITLRAPSGEIVRVKKIAIDENSDTDEDSGAIVIDVSPIQHVEDFSAPNAIIVEKSNG